MRTIHFTNIHNHIKFSFMKQTILSLSFLCLFIAGKSQSFIGYNTSNYTGVSGVFFNPANAADSRYHWSFNLLQIDASVANNAASYKLSEAADALNDDQLLNKLYAKRDAYAQANVDLLGPSLLFNVTHKTSFAFTTRYRALITLNDVDGNLVQAIRGDDATAEDFQVTNNNTSMALNGWLEGGITWGNIILDKGNHFLKGGITAKYLGGVANNTIAAHKINSGISYNGSSYSAFNASGDVSLAFGGASLSNLEVGDLFKFNGTGVGFDLGLSYEYRPTLDSTYDRSDNKYWVKVSLALLDAGSIKFKKDAARSSDYTVGVNNSEHFNLDALNADLDDIKGALDANPAFFTPKAGSNSGSYKVSLPTRLRADVDVHLHKGFYVNAATQLSLANRDDAFKQSYYNNTVITPRLEGRVLGLYVPMQVNSITGFNAGVAVRLGPLVLGSSNIFTALGGSKMANVYFGFRMAGSAFRKEKK